MRNIIEASKFVANRAQNVKIKRVKIKEFERLIDQYSSKPSPKWKGGLYPKEAEFFILWNALNFKFWEKKGNYIHKNVNEFNGNKYYGSLGLAACLRRAISEGVPLYDATYLKKINLNEAERIFSGSIRMPMLEERIKILHEVGEQGGSLNTFIERTEPELSALVQELIKTYPSFNDASKYGSKEIPFYKRAQLLFQMSHTRGDLKIKNIEETTVAADYRLPQALRELGIIKYSKSLANKVDRYKLIPAGSIEEVEIRASTIYACELIRQQFELPISRIDNILWRFGRDCTKPHHLTETTAY